MGWDVVTSAVAVGAAAAAAASPGVAVEVRGKGSASGIFCLMQADRVDRAVRNLGRRPAWEKAHVAGFALRTFWDKVEPVEGQLDWAHFDEGVALARRHGKALGLSLAGGMRTPEWVYAAGAERFPFTWRTHFAPESQAVMPLPWDETYLSKWDALLQAMGPRYDAEPCVAYVTMGGLAFASETHFVRDRGDLPRFEEAGGLPRWCEAAKRIIDSYARAFPTTPFVLAMATPAPGSEGEAALREVVKYGTTKYPGRFGVMNHGLNAQSSARWYLNALVESLSDATTVGFQMVWSTRGPSARMLRGTLPEALQRAVELKGHFVEVYEADCNDAQYAGALEQSSRQLMERAAQP